MPKVKEPRMPVTEKAVDHRTRPAFGFIINWGVSNPYSSPMWWGAAEAAEELDVDLVGFGDVNTYYPQRN
ncbi:MAG TPA: hypothetical protein VMC09_09155, partial [Anaerolineales bacterium]|nr:hypothetical protein [Anaerolineales bacterium]